MFLVIGASGSLGRKITDGLLERGERVRLLARPGSPPAPVRASGAEIAIGDLTDRASLDRACRDVEVLITTASVSKTGTDTIENVDLHGNLAAVAAAREAGVRHFVFVSTLAASETHPVPVFRAKAATERRLRESGMVFTILRPNGFMDVWFPTLIERPAWSGLPVTLVGESRRRHSFVAEQDVAAFAIAAPVHLAARNATLAIGGPEAVTLRDVVAEYERASGRSIPVRTVAPGEAIPGVPDAVAGIAAALETFDSPVAMEETCREFGIHLTSVGEFARSRVALASS